MKIATVTLNPAVDQTVRVDHLQTNQVNRGDSMQFDAGGKGVNVASYLADYGLEVAVTGFLGEQNLRIFEELFARKGIGDRFVRIPGRTRTNVKIVDEANQQTTDINMKGEVPSPTAVRELYETVDELAATCDWFVLTGSLPPGVPQTIYATLIAQIKAQGRQVILDTSREALQEGVLAGPTAVKPNIHELEQLVGQALPDRQAVEAAARELLGYGVELVVVSMGAEGALFVDSEQALMAVPPAVTVKSTVGAGDAMVAGLLAGQAEGVDLAATAQLATAFSAGAITRVGAHLPATDQLQKFVDQVRVTALSEFAQRDRAGF